MSGQKGRTLSGQSGSELLNNDQLFVCGHLIPPQVEQGQGGMFEAWILTFGSIFLCAGSEPQQEPLKPDNSSSTMGHEIDMAGLAALNHDSRFFGQGGFWLFHLFSSGAWWSVDLNPWFLRVIGKPWFRMRCAPSSKNPETRITNWLADVICGTATALGLECILGLECLLVSVSFRCPC